MPTLSVLEPDSNKVESKLCVTAHFSRRSPQQRRCDWYAHIFDPFVHLLTLYSHVAELSQRFQTDGMLAYVDLVQRKEKAIGCDVLTHQRWYIPTTYIFLVTANNLTIHRSGANYIDRVLASVSSGSASTSSTGNDSTEHTF
jgi:isocitrate lyase